MEPTLTSSEREAYVLELLQTNAECRLPCWVGLTPGKTSWVEAERFLKHLASPISADKFDDAILHSSAAFDMGKRGVYNSFFLGERQGTIDTIYINADGQYHSADFRAIWKYFAPEQIMGTYGQPSRVWVFSEAHGGEVPEPPSISYSLWVLYDQLGVLIRYGGLVRYASTYHMCPTFEGNGNLGYTMEIILQSPTDKTPLEERYAQIHATSVVTPITIADAAGLSIADFYQLFKQKAKSICFDTPRSMWP